MLSSLQYSGGVCVVTVVNNKEYFKRFGKIYLLPVNIYIYIYIYIFILSPVKKLKFSSRVYILSLLSHIKKKKILYNIYIINFNIR